MFNKTTSTLGVPCPVEYSHGQGVSVTLVALFHGASPVEYRLNQDRAVRLERYSTGESHLLSDLPLFSELSVLGALRANHSLSSLLLFSELCVLRALRDDISLLCALYASHLLSDLPVFIH